MFKVNYVVFFWCQKESTQALRMNVLPLRLDEQYVNDFKRVLGFMKIHHLIVWEPWLCTRVGALMLKTCGYLCIWINSPLHENHGYYVYIKVFHYMRTMVTMCTSKFSTIWEPWLLRVYQSWFFVCLLRTMAMKSRNPNTLVI